jgi:hypothetical protein
MYSATEIQMLRSVDPGAKIPGIDTAVGNNTPASSLKGLSSIPTTSSGQPFYYDPSQNTVFVQQAGAVLNGYDFGSADVVVVASNVTIENCTFDNPGGSFAVGVYNTPWSPATTNTTVTGCTFIGNPASTLLASINDATGSATITGNKFLNSAGDGIWADGGGLISGNYFSQAGNDGDAGHPDAIWVTNSTKPLTISDNFIDWSQNPAGGTVCPPNDCIRITGEVGPVSNVTVTGNFLLNGATSISAVNASGQAPLSNISITDNYLEGATYYTFYPCSMSGSTVSGDVVVDQVYLDGLWNAYKSAGLPTANVAASTDGSTVTASSGPTTLYADGLNTLMVGGASENNFVSGYSSQNMWAGSGANIFTYLSPAQSTATDPDTITNFDPAKDVIDLSHIDGDLSASGVQNFAFIGTSAFDGKGPEVRYQQNANGTTDVQVALAGDTTPDMQIDLSGLLTLTAANFALTTAQSQAAMTDGAKLSDSVTSVWPLTETQYSNVEGRAYSSYTSIQSGSFLVADDLALSASSDQINLFGPSGESTTAVTIARGGGAESITSDGKTDSLAYRQNEMIQASGALAPETFAFSSGFGNEIIAGFATSGANADTLELSTAAFSYLNASMTSAQKLAAVLSHVTAAPGGATIADSHGDTLMLGGVSAATLGANPGLVKFT